MESVQGYNQPHTVLFFLSDEANAEICWKIWGNEMVDGSVFHLSRYLLQGYDVANKSSFK